MNNKFDLADIQAAIAHRGLRVQAGNGKLGGDFIGNLIGAVAPEP